MFESGILVFEGQYLNNKRKKFGKEYDLNNEILYEGEYINDEYYIIK